MVIELTIMSGAGNVFSVIDNRVFNFSANELSALAPLICSRSYSKGKTEGLLVINDLSKISNADFDVLFFNPDGSTGMICGNGGRCAILYALEKNIVSKEKEKINFSFSNKTFSAYFDEKKISIEFPPPKTFRPNVELKINDFLIIGDFVDVGSPHFVLLLSTFGNIAMDEFRSFDVDGWGSKIRFHKHFCPNGTNVDFVFLHAGKIYLRTYERGVENETGACGTGALSVGYDLFVKKGFNFPLTIIPTSGEELQIDARFEGESIKNLILSGTAKILEKNIIKI